MLPPFALRLAAMAIVRWPSRTRSTRLRGELPCYPDRSEPRGEPVRSPYTFRDLKTGRGSDAPAAAMMVHTQIRSRANAIRDDLDRQVVLAGLIARRSPSSASLPQGCGATGTRHTALGHYSADNHTLDMRTASASAAAEQSGYLDRVRTSPKR